MTSTKVSSLLKTFCPSCFKEYEEYQGYDRLLCIDCTDKRDDKVEHSEEAVQKEIQKNLDNNKKRY